MFFTSHPSTCLGHDPIAGSLVFLPSAPFDRYSALQTGNTPQQLQLANIPTYLPSNHYLVLMKLAQSPTFVSIQSQNIHLFSCTSIYNYDKIILTSGGLNIMPDL